MNGIFAVNKPVGQTSRETVDIFKRLLSKQPGYKASISEKSGSTRRKHSKYIKIGHGGTLDPLASGVLVIGVGSGTRLLSKYLGNCTKTYRAVAIFGASTTTYDSEGSILKYSEVSHLTNELIIEALKKFSGEIVQYPPVYSALKMNGKPLYEYARNNEPLPKEIQPRACQIDKINIIGEGLKTDHDYEYPKSEASKVEQELSDELQKLSKIDYSQVKYIESPPEKPPIVEIEFTVSSGTYIRSLIHDLGRELNTTAHMVGLERISQGSWELNKNVFELDYFKKKEPHIWNAVLTRILRQGPEESIQSVEEEIEKDDKPDNHKPMKESDTNI